MFRWCQWNGGVLFIYLFVFVFLIYFILFFYSGPPSLHHPFALKRGKKQGGEKNGGFKGSTATRLRNARHICSPAPFGFLSRHAHFPILKAALLSGLVIMSLPALSPHLTSILSPAASE